MLGSEISRAAIKLFLLPVLGFTALSYAAQAVMAQTGMANPSSAPSPVSPQREANEQLSPAPVIVAGEVRSPTRFVLRRQVRLLEILAQVGGLTEQAGETVRLVRRSQQPAWSESRQANGSGEPSEREEVFVYQVSDLRRGDERANPYLQPGDVVIVSTTGVIHVVGQVAQPQGLFITVASTLAQAIESAGGLRPGANGEEVEICRQVNDGQEVRRFKVNLTAIRERRAADIRLQANDVIFVPERERSGWRRGRRLCMPQGRVVEGPLTGLPLRVLH